MEILDLFSGIGGFSLGLERAGMKTIAFCENDEKCRKELKKTWPLIPIYEDIRKLTYDRLIDDRISKPDVLCGGFPCTDISNLGKRAGINGGQSGLWSEFVRLIGEIRPKYAIVENVANLLRGERGAWFSRILGDLAKIGYDVEWEIISAAAVGANHLRERVWITAYSQGIAIKCSIYQKIPWIKFFKSQSRRSSWTAIPGTHWAESQPEFFEVDDGVPGWPDAAKQYGNAVVPQIPELIGKAILKHDKHNQSLK